MDSKTLFIQQVDSHSQTLAELLACPTGEAVGAEVMARSLISTRMLSGTTALMGYGAWETLLNAAHRLLERFGDGGLGWDERVAQFVSELIEREEALAEAHRADPSSNLGEVIPADQLDALVAEIEAISEELVSAPPAPVAAAPPRDPAATAAADPEPPVDLRDLGATPAPEADEEDIELPELDAAAAAAEGEPLAGIVSELRASAGRLLERLRSRAWRSREWNSTEFDGIRRELGMLDFYVRSVEKIINRNADSIRPRCSLEPLRVTLAEFAAELVHGTTRRLNVELDGVDLLIDPHLLPTAEGIVQSMVRDAFERTETGDLSVRISVEQRHGALRWRVSDDGNNLISDSQLDHDDHLAFYPGLKQVMHALSECRGMLSVEPRDAEHARFEFTLPVSREPEPLVSWTAGEQTFVVRASQLLELVPADDARRGNDAYGEFFELDGRRVPLLRLDLLYSDAPGAGPRVAVLGAIEKRIAVYVPDDGSPRTGAILGDTTSVWKGPPQPVARLDGNRVPVLDTDAILGGYLGVTGAVGDDYASGGAMEDELDTIQSQAASRDAQAPPSLWTGSSDSGTEPIEVLVVEQSAAMRGELTSILSQNRVKAAFVGRVEEAVDVIQTRAPRLIISEFRMPSMAAKKLVDKLKNEGWHIPVLVTTSQKGKTADLLVEKLGVNGYLSKPLEPEDVASRIQGILGAVVS